MSESVVPPSEISGIPTPFWSEEIVPVPMAELDEAGVSEVPAKSVQAVRVSRVSARISAKNCFNFMENTFSVGYSVLIVAYFPWNVNEVPKSFSKPS